jgi:hypothetical protein
LPAASFKGDDKPRSYQPAALVLLMTGATPGVARFRWSSVSGSRDYNANAYASGPTDPFGTVSTDAEQTSLYATYTPG